MALTTEVFTVFGRLAAAAAATAAATLREGSTAAAATEGTEGKWPVAVFAAAVIAVGALFAAVIAAAMLLPVYLGL